MIMSGTGVFIYFTLIVLIFYEELRLRGELPYYKLLRGHHVT